MLGKSTQVMGELATEHRLSAREPYLEWRVSGAGLEGQLGGVGYRNWLGPKGHEVLVL